MEPAVNPEEVNPLMFTVPLLLATSVALPAVEVPEKVVRPPLLRIVAFPAVEASLKDVFPLPLLMTVALSAEAVFPKVVDPL